MDPCSHPHPIPGPCIHAPRAAGGPPAPAKDHVQSGGASSAVAWGPLPVPSNLSPALDTPWGRGREAGVAPLAVGVLGEEVQDQQHHGQGDHQHQAHDQDHLQPGEGAPRPLSTHDGGSVGAGRSLWCIPVRGTAQPEHTPHPQRAARMPTAVSEMAAAQRRMGSGDLFFILRQQKRVSCWQQPLPVTRPDRTGRAPKSPTPRFPGHFAHPSGETLE